MSSAESTHAAQSDEHHLGVYGEISHAVCLALKGSTSGRALYARQFGWNRGVKYFTPFIRGGVFLVFKIYFERQIDYD